MSPIGVMVGVGVLNECENARIDFIALTVDRGVIYDQFGTLCRSSFSRDEMSQLKVKCQGSKSNPSTTADHGKTAEAYQHATALRQQGVLPRPRPGGKASAQAPTLVGHPPTSLTPSPLFPHPLPLRSSSGNRRSTKRSGPPTPAAPAPPPPPASPPR